MIELYIYGTVNIIKTYAGAIRKKRIPPVGPISRDKPYFKSFNKTIKSQTNKKAAGIPPAVV